MSKLNAFYKKFRFPLLIITTGIVLLIVILCYTLIPIRNQFSYIDINDGGNYCDNLNEAYASGVDLETFDNVTKVAEFVDNSTTHYDIHFDDHISPYRYYDKFTPKIYINALDSNLVSDKNISFITGGNDNLKIEIYIMANIKQKDLVKKLFAFEKFYGMHHLPYTPEWEIIGPGSFTGKQVYLEKNVYTIYGNSDIKWTLKDNVNLNPHIVYNNDDSSNNDTIDPYINAQFKYFVTVTSKAGVTVKFVELPEDAPLPY